MKTIRMRTGIKFSKDGGSGGVGKLGASELGGRRGDKKFRTVGGGLPH